MTVRRSLRIATHVHTDWSFDGSWSLRRIARAFKVRGYQVVMTAEHSQSLDQDSWIRYRRACAEESTAGIRLLPGIEYRDSNNRVHIPVWGDAPYLGDMVDVTTLLEEVANYAAAAVLAHPSRRDAWQVCNPEWAPLLSGVEVWNRKYDGWAPSQAGLELAREWGKSEIVSLDFHRRRQFFPFALTLPLPESSTDDQICDGVRLGMTHWSFLRTPDRIWHGPSAGKVLSAMETSRREFAMLLRGPFLRLARSDQ